MYKSLKEFKIIYSNYGDIMKNIIEEVTEALRIAKK